MKERTGTPDGRSTMAEYLRKPDWLLTPIPDDIGDDHAAMGICGLGPTFGACELLGVGRQDTVLITGLGPVGLGGVINARYRGARSIGVEANPYRVELARRLGADEVVTPGEGALDAVRDLTGGRGADRVIECSASPEAQRFALDAAALHGRVAMVGYGGSVDLNVAKDLLQKGLTVVGAWHYRLGEAPRVMKMIRDVTDELDQLVTHRFPLSRIQDAWELQCSGQCGKVLLYPWGTEG
jgi:L-iditol 2-dehydrogenase